MTAAPLVIPFFIPHQGCPHQCVFCNQSVITGKNDRVIASEMERLIQDYLPFKGHRKRVEFAFFGGNFLGLPPHRICYLLERVYPYVEKGLVHGVRCSTRPDTVTRDVLDLVCSYGLELVELGVQSLDDGVLAASERGHTREDTLKALELLKSKNMKIGVQVMVGLPGDTLGKALETVRVLAGRTPDLARIYPLLVLAGSKMAQWYAQGRYTPLSLDDAVMQVKEMYKVFFRAGVPVVRMGLQSGEMMSDPSQMLAGPWHPAFGHLVYSALMFDQVCAAIDALPQIHSMGTIQLQVSSRSLSRLQGNKKINLQRLAEKYPGMGFQIIINDTLSPDQVIAIKD
ncbi:MAG: histone acetyltransferase [Desulfobacterales bacterium]|nr:MAG: histone acetyltransferase [Desulfobacterales bacterium]